MAQNEAVKIFLELDNPVEWDFVNEFAETNELAKEYKELKDPFKKYFVFRLCRDDEPTAYEQYDQNFRDLNEYGKSLADPDTKSLLLQRVYSYLWPELTELSFMKDNKTILAETMHSVQTTLNEIMRSIDKNSTLKNMIERPKFKNGRTAEYSRIYAIALYAYKPEEFVKELNKYSGLEDFIRYYHTIGNFIPVPRCFNSGRSTRTKDYWDLTLFHIYKWYMAVGDEQAQNVELHNLLLAGEDAVNHCRDWLIYFRTWQDFVDKNFLQDFVNIANGIYGCPKELWPGHFSGPLLPVTKVQMEAFCTNASSQILARGNRMVIALKGKLREEIEK